MIGLENESDPSRRDLPVWCGGCGKYLLRNEPHIDDCTVMIENVKKEQREKSAPERSHVVALIYGVFVLVLIAAFIVWNRFF